ncbi:heterokaryon incompatibility protein-domain-containing protein [Neurospora crassa]|nr:heterokaryon incompatibility protein-domain-containing protein [Neurospora crassa]
MQVVFSQRAPKTCRVSTRALVLQSFDFDRNGELTGISSHFKPYPSITMWLINTRTLELEEFVGADIPAYAILSHTWETGEVTFHDAKAKLLGKQTSQGARKVAKACEVAAEHGLAYAWVDTCCIDKSSSAELTEAINSMFQWYRLSQICLVYLSDLKAVELDHAMYMSRWFKRGWTLQELIAPPRLIFYDQDWKKRGTKEDLASLLSKITRIDIGILLDPSRVYTVPVGKRMSWAADRQTTRLEDRAYSLLGIFDINMPLIYGEGPKAFTRLQEEIIRRSNDVSIFCWRTQENTRWRGILASSPDEFKCAADTEDDMTLKNGPEYTLTNKGLRTELDLASAGPNLYLMALYCTDYFKDEWECIYLTAIGALPLR